MRITNPKPTKYQTNPYSKKKKNTEVLLHIQCDHITISSENYTDVNFTITCKFYISHYMKTV